MKVPMFVIFHFTLLNLSNCFNILAVIPFPSKSHFKSFSTFFKNLALKGHNVTVLSYHPQKNSLPNYTDIDIGHLDIIMSKFEQFSYMSRIKTDRLAMYRLVLDLADIGYLSCEFALQSVNHFLKEDNSFNVILIEDFCSECFWPLVQKYQCPVIQLAPHRFTAWSGKQHGVPLASVYVPNVYQPQEHKMSFFGRLENSVVNLFHILHHYVWVLPTQEQIAKRYVDVDETSFNNNHFNASLVLLNSHFLVSSPRPLVPNIIEVGGIHIEEPKRLPKISGKIIRQNYCSKSQPVMFRI